MSAAEGGSIFVANLPMDATPEQLNETFKGFGAIRKDSIQVRSYRVSSFFFGFNESFFRHKEKSMNRFLIFLSAEGKLFRLCDIRIC